MAREICIPCPDNNREFEVYLPSPLEGAFNAELRKRFKTGLSNPTLNEHNQLVRISNPVIVGNRALSFRYKRMDPLSDDSAAILVLEQELQPEEIIDLPNYNPESGQDPADARIIESIKQKITKRDGKFEPIKALMDPNYYSTIETISQWPEQFDFVLTDKDRETNIRGTLSMFASFEGYDTMPGFGGGEFIVKYPELFNRIVKSYETAYKSDSKKLTGKSASSSASYFPNIRGIKMPVCLSTHIKPPEEIMSEFATFVQELCKKSE